MLPRDLFKDTIILELASVLAGPSVGQFFAELGARVIKVENHRNGGDVTRSWRTADEVQECSAYFSSVNWGKESIGIDLSDKRGQELVFRLVSKSSVVITSFKTGSARKLNMDYHSLKRIRPDIIYAGITGYGEQSVRVGYDGIIQAESGFMYLNGPDEETPQKMPVALIDILAAHQLKQAILVAWIHRMQTGEGGEVTISLIDAALSSLANQASNYLVGGTDPGPKGSLHPNIAPYGEIVLTRDRRKVILAIGNDRQFAKLCNILKVPQIARKPEFSENTARITHREELHDILSRAALKLDFNELFERATALAIPLGEIRTVSEALDLAADSLILASDGMRGIRTFAPSTIESLSAPPTLGMHTASVLTSLLDLDPDEYAQLRAQDIVA